MAKKVVQVNVWMTQRDLKMLLKSAQKRWPDVELTRSQIVLSLAKIAAKEIIGKPSPKS